MKIGILSVTSAGEEIALQLKNSWADDPSVVKVDNYHKNVKHNLTKIFNSYDIIVGIMASGIMIRSISNLLKSKKTDPGIVLIDEKSRYVISLIGGHLGGANHIAIKIAKLIGAEPVITTATDINDKVGLDSLAYYYYWDIKNPELIVEFNQAILNGEKIGLISKSCISYLFNDSKVVDSYYLINKRDYLKRNSIEIKDDELVAVLKDKKILLTPKKIVMGLGSRKGVSRQQVLEAINKAIQNLEIPISRIDSIATAEIKREEKGIIEAASYLGLPMETVSVEVLREFKSPQCSNSKWVKEKFNVGGVCEPSALIIAGENSQLILKKTAHNQVTVAVAKSE